MPSLWVGLQSDDLFIRIKAMEGVHPIPELRGPAWQTYTMLDGDPAKTQILVDRGWMPWWVDLETRYKLLRPLTGSTQILDFAAWPNRPVLMHVQNLAWFAMMSYAAATLYRRLIGSSQGIWVAALAALLFTVDDARAISAGWLANRNAVIAGCFGIFCLIAHDRWRRDGWQAGMVVAPLMLVFALCGKEEAVCTFAYLISYALFLDKGSFRSRIASLVPAFAAGLVWFAWYKWQGGGAFATGVYVDPANEPIRFIGRVIRNGPILLLGQWALPPSDASMFLSPTAFRVMWAWAIVILALLGWMMMRVIRLSPEAWFFTVGMLLAIVPVCGIFPNDRLLTFIGIGGAGLLAIWLKEIGVEAVSTTGLRHERIAAPVLIGIHMVLAPMVFPLKAYSMKLSGATLGNLFDTLPNDDAIENQTVIFANTLCGVTDSYMMMHRMYYGLRVPKRSLNLGAACSRVTIQRPDATTLIARPEGGYVPPREWSPERGDRKEWASTAFLLQHIDRMGRSPVRPMKHGETIDLSYVDIEITALNDAERPTEATFRFDRPIDDGSFRWLEMTGNGFVPFVPPKIGETVHVNAAWPPSRQGK